MLKKATLEDAQKIHRLINTFARERLMLGRSLNYIYDRIRDFWVYKEKNRVLGCCSLNIVGWQDLAEIKSLAVDKKHQKKGLGKALVKISLKEAKELGIKKVFVLTYESAFFKKFGFKTVSKDKLPHKIWADCLNCPEFPACKEEALIRKI
ncbi:MAG: N-acetyltransferase [Candidatus Omnitrophica bacterium]|nr:N-acetyltransferase [Candidatus Omnitrophota bacterium]